MAIGEFSRRTGGNIETIRYYERIGLLPVPDRSRAISPLWCCRCGAACVRPPRTRIGLHAHLDKGSHSVNRLLDLAEGNPQIFTPDAFDARRQGTGPTRPEYLDDYLTSVYVPLPADFQALRRRVDEQRTIYAAYKDIRNKIFAHKDIVGTVKMHELLGKTNIREWQTLTLFLLSLYDALWQLYCNGIKPVLREYRCSVEAMLNDPIPAGRQMPPQEKIARQAAEFLTAAAARWRS